MRYNVVGVIDSTWAGRDASSVGRHRQYLGIFASVQEALEKAAEHPKYFVIRLAPDDVIAGHGSLAVKQAAIAAGLNVDCRLPRFV